MKLIIIILTGIVLIGCSTGFNSDGKYIHELQEKVRHGDTLAYFNLMDEYQDFPPEHTLFWAMLMANEHDYDQAYLDTYYAICYSYQINRPLNGLSQLSPRTKKLALEYLNIAIDRNVEDAIEEKELLNSKHLLDYKTQN